MLILLIAAALVAGCASQSVKKGKSGLELLYVADVPEDDAGCSALYSTINGFENPLVVVDDPTFSTISDLAWWEGQRELFLLDSLGTGLFFLPSSWMLLGSDKLKELSSQADFFILAMNLSDDSLRYILPRYMIRRQGSYRLAFSAAVKSDKQTPAIKGENLLPVDSLLPVTASYLAMQSDFFFFFHEDSLREIPAGMKSIARGHISRQLSFNFRSTSEYRLTQKPLKISAASDISPCTLWESLADSLDSEVLVSSSAGITMDSLRYLAVNAFGAGESTMIYLGEGVIKDSLPAGDITFGKMRKVLAAEIFLAVSAQDFINAMGEDEEKVTDNVKKVIIPSSMFIDNQAFSGVRVEPTGFTSAWLARMMFAKEEK